MRVEVVEIENGKEQRFPVELVDDIISFGRGAQLPNFVQLPRCGGNELSRVHCTLMKDGEEWWFCSGEPGCPVGAKNGCWLDGKLVTRPVKLQIGQSFLLHSGDECDILLRVSPDEWELDDTLTPVVERVCSSAATVQDMTELHAAIESLSHDLTENRRLDIEGRSNLSRLAASKAAIVEAFTDFRAEADRKFAALDAEVERSKAASATTKRTMKRLLWAVFGLGVAVLIDGLVSYDWHSHEFFAELRGELVYTALSLAVLYVLKKLE